jgi:hypothetical protein
LDNQNTVFTGIGGTGKVLNVQAWNTRLHSVYPLDGNRLTREWFHSGRAEFHVTGDNADDFEGTLELGYQIGFPWSLGVGINFSYTTPNVLLDDVSIAPNDFNPLGAIITPNLFPGVSINADIGNGPGIQEVATFSVDVRGKAGAVTVADAHGTVTGALGGVKLRPFARLISKQGDSVSSYGEVWFLN